jgi:N-acetylneuraminic acid mutarotase
VAAIGTTVISADGYNPNTGDTGDNEAYDITTNSWRALTFDPQPRDEACTASIGGQLYVAGGVHNGVERDSTEEFKLSSNSWTTKATMPNWVTYAAGTTQKGLFYCFGGGSSNTFQGSYFTYVQIYQP